MSRIDSTRYVIVLSLLSLLSVQVVSQSSSTREDSVLQSKIYAWGGIDSFYLKEIRHYSVQPFSESDSQATRRMATRLKEAAGVDVKLSKAGLKFNLANPFRVIDGSVNYQFQYRSYIDTPLYERDVFQNTVIAQLNTVIGDIIPVGITYMGRRSNSALLRDLNDIQVSFNRNSFQQLVQARLLSNLESTYRQLLDSLDDKGLAQVKGKIQGYRNWLGGSMQLQKLIEVNEILNVPRITYDPGLPEEENRKREMLYKKAALFFKSSYDEIQGLTANLQAKLDSAEKRLDKFKNRLADLEKLKQRIKLGREDYGSLLKEAQRKGTVGLDSVLPSGFKWLLGVRRVSVGRSPVNYSELTGKNLAINGVNLEYGDRFYVALAAGRVDYRFRDFVVNRTVRRLPQPLLFVKAGLGKPEQSHVYLTAFKGTKQLINGSSARRGLDAIKIAGTGIEAKWAINRYHFIEGEYVQTFSEDIRSNPITSESSRKGWDDKNRRGYSVHFVSQFPRLLTRIEGSYRYTGSDFQSFNNYQTVTTRESWMMKWDQGLFKRKLRLSLSVRQNEFSNPYLVQRYNSSTVFKSATLTFYQRRWPTITVGYLPVSQVVVLDSLLVETRFQALYGSAVFQYLAGNTKAASMIVLHRFYNSNSDSAYAYYNATNLVGSQTFYFSAFTSATSLSYTSNPNYSLSVIDENFVWNLRHNNTLGFGIKVNNYKKEIVKVGGYLSARWRVFKEGVLTVQYERGFLPGYRGDLIAASFGNIQFTKFLRFQK